MAELKSKPVVAIRVRCPDCRMAVYVANGDRMPITCSHCHRSYGPGRQPLIEVDTGHGQDSLDG